MPEENPEPDNREPENPEPPPPPTTVWQGIRLTLLLHLIQIPLGLFTLFISPLIIGVSQLVYILPAIHKARKRNETGKVQGLIIGASVTFLLNAACWGAFSFLPLLGPS